MRTAALMFPSASFAFMAVCHASSWLLFLVFTRFVCFSLAEPESHPSARFLIVLVRLWRFPPCAGLVNSESAKSSRAVHTSIEFGVLQIALSVDVRACAHAGRAPLHMWRGRGPLISGWLIEA